MSRLDDRLTQELERIARPVAQADAFQQVDRRRARRHLLRRAQAAALAVVVLVGTAGGFVYLSDAFQEGSPNVGDERSPFPVVPRANGVIAAAQQDQAGNLSLVTVNPDGSERRVIPTPLASGAWLSAWSPDGSRLAVATSAPGLGPLAIWVMNADGSNPIKIAEATNIYQPSWSPDGTQIAYAADLPDGAAIHVVDPDGTGDRVIGELLQQENHHYYSASFSPDGTRILYDVGTGPTSDIYVMAVDGTNPTQLTTTGTDYAPSWSPDGLQIAFSRTRQGGGSDIYVMDDDGSDVRRLTDGGADITNRNPTWSPDGTSIAYQASAVIDGVGALVIMDAGGSHPVTILDDGVFGISWQPLPDTATPAPATADLGLGFPVCDVRSLSADFDGNGTPDTASVATKMSDIGGCLQQDETTVVLAVDTNGDGSADLSGGPLVCDPWCIPYAAPDINGDGQAELVLDQGHLASPVSAALSVYELSGTSIGVIAFPDGSTSFDVNAASSVYMAGAFCSTDGSGQPLFTVWRAPTADGGATYDLVERNYRVDEAALRFRLDGSAHDTLTNSSPWPENPAQTDTLCGVPAAPLG